MDFLWTSTFFVNWSRSIIGKRGESFYPHFLFFVFRCTSLFIFINIRWMLDVELRCILFFLQMSNFAWLSLSFNMLTRAHCTMCTVWASIAIKMAITWIRNDAPEKLPASAGYLMVSCSFTFSYMDDFMLGQGKNVQQTKSD